MNVLIVKLGATGDVVRTTVLLRCLTGHITWLTAEKNLPLVATLNSSVRCLSWDQRAQAMDKIYDLIVNLEDEIEVAEFVATIENRRLFGAYIERENRKISYTPDASAWFDLSLISVHGRQEADRLKLLNRKTYQELILDGLGYSFMEQEYVLPDTNGSGLHGDVALSPVAGPVWPMKAWAFYDELKTRLESLGLVVNVLPTRSTLLEHLADVRGHRCLVSGDSLPMHLALGSGIRCVSLFTCTSPWEIYGYGRQIKLISPCLDDFFYKRGFDRRASTAITLESVLDATVKQLEIAQS
jgi:heptosyltransferase II